MLYIGLLDGVGALARPLKLGLSKQAITSHPLGISPPDFIGM